jgi:hypothetical protein
MNLTRTRAEQLAQLMADAADELVFDRMSPEDRGRLSGNLIIALNELRCEVARQEPRVIHCVGGVQ